MNVSLGPEAEKLIRKKLDAGDFATPEAVVLAGLHALTQCGEDDFELGELDALLAEGEASLRVGGPVRAEDVLAELQRMGTSRPGKSQ